MKSLLLYPSVAFGAYKKFDRAGVTWAEAQRKCVEIGSNLVTFEDENEFNDFNAWLGDTTEAYWVGYRDDAGPVVTYDDKPAAFTKFTEGEPNNKMGDENCIRFRFGEMNDALCEIFWAGPKKQNIGMGFICEGDFEEEGLGDSVERALEIDSSTMYKKFDRAGLTWPEAQHKCNEMGADLVTFEDENEFISFNAWLGDTTEAYWTGYRDDHGDIVPAGYTTFSEGEPNNKLGDENCIRLRHGAMNDAMCEIYWAGPKKQNIGMGYICKGNFQKEASPPVRQLSGPEYISFSVTLPMSQRKRMKAVNGLYKITENSAGGRPIYHSQNDDMTYLSYYWDETQMTESDGFWKFSTQKQVNKLGGHVFLVSNAQEPMGIDTEGKCYYIRSVGRKNPVYEKINCLKDPVIHEVTNAEAAVSVNIMMASGKARLINGIYQPTTDVVGIKSSKTIYQKLDNSMYVIHQDGKWNFHTPRTLTKHKPLITISSESDLADLSADNGDYCAFTKTKSCPFSVSKLV